MSGELFTNYIAGSWVTSSNAKLNINPSDLNDTIGHYAQASSAQTNEAIECAGMDFHAPITGRKGSSYGAPEKGSLYREFFTTAKVAHKGRG